MQRLLLRTLLIMMHEEARRRICCLGQPMVWWVAKCSWDRKNIINCYIAEILSISPYILGFNFEQSVRHPLYWLIVIVMHAAQDDSGQCQTTVDFWLEFDSLPVRIRPHRESIGDGVSECGGGGD